MTRSPPACGFGDVRLGRLADDEAHASAGLVQALLDAGAHDRPALTGIRVALEVGKATIEFDGLRLGVFVNPIVDHRDSPKVDHL
jgi:hypothetical protein